VGNVTPLRPPAKPAAADPPSTTAADSRQTNFFGRVDFNLTDNFLDNEQILLGIAEQFRRLGGEMQRAHAAKLDPQMIMPGVCEQLRRLSRKMKRHRPRGPTIRHDND